MHKKNSLMFHRSFFFVVVFFVFVSQEFTGFINYFTSEKHDIAEYTCHSVTNYRFRFISTDCIEVLWPNCI